MKAILIGAAYLAMLLAGPASAIGQEWPTRPVTMIVPAGLGGAVDIIGRVVAARMAEFLGRPIVVENVTGAGGMIGAARVGRAEPDGYQILLGTIGTQALNQTLYKTPLYDARSDFTPVALLVDVPIILTVRPDMPVTNLKEFAAFTKANQGKMQYGSPGPGSSNHLACLLLNTAIGVDAVTHIPYRNAPELNQDLMSGRIDYYCPSSTAAMTLVQGNQAKAIAVLGSSQVSIFPTLTSAPAQGFPQIEAGTWFGFFMPKNAPAAIVQKLNAATVDAITNPEVLKRVEALGGIVAAPDRRSPTYLAEFVQGEIKKWAGPIKSTGLLIE